MRKSFLSLAIAASMAITSVSFAADGDKPKKPEGDKPAAAKGGFKALDKNGDGKLSKEEVKDNKRLTENFAKIDTNSDGSIDEAEMKAAAPAKKPAGDKPAGEKKKKAE